MSQYDYTYDDRGFISAEDAIESLYGYAYDDKHNGKHENWHDNLYPHGNKHNNKHDKDGIYGFQIIETKRAFTYDDDGKLLTAIENEDKQGKTEYTFKYDDMGNRTSFEKIVRGKKAEGAEYVYNDANQMISARLYDGKHYKNVEYSYDADGNRTKQEEIKDDGTRKTELVYEYTVESRLKAVSDKNDLLTAMAYDGDGNRIFQLNYNLHTDDDWKGNSGNGNGNNKDNTGSGNSGKSLMSDLMPNLLEQTFGEGWDSVFTEEKAAPATAEAAPVITKSNGNKDKDKGNNGNTTNNGKGNGNGNSGNGNGNNGNGNNGNTSTGGTNDNNGNANGNTNNTGGSQNQSGILFPAEGEVSELEQEMIDEIKTTGKQKNYELVEYVNDVNREHTEVLMELNINGIMDTAYSYGDQRLTNERFTGWTGYYTYDPRGSVSGVTDDEGMIWQSYRYDVSGEITFGKPQYNNVYGYNAESYNPNVDSQYLRARYYSVGTGNFLSEDSYLGNITDPLSLNRYNYVKSSPLNYMDPSGHVSKNGSYDPTYQSNAGYTPYAAGQQSERYWKEWSGENYAGLNKNQRDQLAENMAMVESYSLGKLCGKMGEGALEFVLSFLYGASSAVLMSLGAVPLMTRDLMIQVFGSDHPTSSDINKYFEEQAINKAAYHMGRIAGDLTAMTAAMQYIIGGGAGAAVGVAGSGVSGGTSLAVTAAGVVTIAIGSITIVYASADMVQSGGALIQMISSGSGAGKPEGDSETEKKVNADDIVERANNSGRIDGLSGTEVDVNTAMEAGQKFVGKGYKTSMENGMIKYTSKDGTKSFRMKNKVGNADYEANFEIFDSKGNVTSNYHVVIKQN